MPVNIKSNTINEIFRSVKPRFTAQLGKFTHHRFSSDWLFYGLAFVKDELTYVFGFNVGFFKKYDSENFDFVGMNVLVRSNEPNEELREKYAVFFRENLKDWFFAEDEYSSFRGAGREFMRYKKIEEFENQDQIIEFIHQSIDALQKVYPLILSNPENIFDDVLRAAFPWHDSIKDICENVFSQNERNS
jgi:hypothetical protein